jgi:tRNA threonylcarbamoyl adenosine modification protein YeaZ
MLLVLDTCFNACSACLFDDVVKQSVASRHETMERGHAEALGPMVGDLFLDARVKLVQVSRVVVTRGPGSFTGLRIGLSYAKGMALALGIPLIGIDSLTAAAVPYFGKPGQFAIALKAGGTGLHYWALFDGATSSRVSGPALANLDDIKTQVDDVHLETGPYAEHFSLYAATLLFQGTVVEPLYLRPPDAKPSAPGATATTRLATPDDIPAMAAIHAESFKPGWDEASLRSSLSISGAGALVVELAGVVYGFVQFQTVTGEAEINTICVSPNYRRQHFGRDLLQGLIMLLQNSGLRKLFLDVAADNQAAIGLYHRFGFEQTGVRRAYYASGQDALLMVKDISI